MPSSADLVHDSNWIHLTVFFVLVSLFQVAVARWNLSREAKRRWQHALTGQALVLTSYYLSVPLCVAGLTLGVTGIAVVRIGFPDVYREAFGPLLRSHELEGNAMPGAFYFLVGTLVSVVLLDMDIARYAVLCLSWADPMAAWVGRSFPFFPVHSSASAGGCLACFVTAFVMGMLTLPPQNMFSVVAGAVACTFAEATPYYDDNLLIPVAVGGFTQHLRNQGY